MASGIAAQDRPTLTALRVRLLAPLTTKFSRKGDMVSARVMEPGEYQNGILEGEVHEVKAAGTGGRTAWVQFDFQKLHISNQVLAVNVSLVGVANSRHEPAVDEDGRAVEVGSRGGGGKRASGAASAVAATPLRLSANGPHVSFAAGSEFTLEMQNLRPH
jgi:hypothetical protein